MTTSPKVITTVAELKAWRKTVVGRVGFVPTMGALHEGHATLLRESRKQSEISVLSIFVNPTQFSPSEDLAKYPRTLERDLEVAAREGVDIVFAPTPIEIYPPGFSTYVEETAVSLPLCGAFRSGHFRGVTTVVLKLFHLVRPEVAFFGLKDAQQFFVLSKMVKDLELDIRVQGIPTVRETDGLALSSRNVYLSSEERKKAPRLYQVLQALKDAISQIQVSSQSTTQASQKIQKELTQAKRVLEDSGFRVQYLDYLVLPDFQLLLSQNLSPSQLGDQPALIALAAYLGNTRLIDNILIHPKKLNLD